jgi:2-octaprenyl-6-methoxyphenol hydroxylase
VDAGVISSGPGVQAVVAGAGPVGLTTAIALHAAGVQVRVLDARPAVMPTEDPRAIALSHGSRLILERLGAWAAVHATPIHRIEISQRNGFGRARIDASDHGIDALGYVTRLAGLTAALARAAGGQGIAIQHDCAVGTVEAAGDRMHLLANGEAITCDLLLRAEGTPGEQAYSKDYGQSAVVAEVWPSGPRDARAWERFTPDGPLALLPLEDGFSLVWCMPPERAAMVAAMGDAEFLAALGDATRFAPYRWRRAGGRRAYPLALVRRAFDDSGREVWLGNAAQTLHPVAGQGLNLGLRDAFELALALRDSTVESALSAWRARRRIDRDAMVRTTDAYVSLFSNDLGPLRLARGIGLALVDTVPALRRFVARRMMFGER